MIIMITTCLGTCSFTMCSSDLFAFVPIVLKPQMPEVKDYVMGDWVFLYTA